MKKIICCILVFTIFLCSFQVPVFAKDWVYANDEMIEGYNKAKKLKDETAETFELVNGMVGNVGSAFGYAIGGSFSLLKNAVLSPIDGFMEGWNTDWKDVVNKGIEDGEIRHDDDYIYIHQNVINNINQKVQNRVHALDGYYLLESSGAITYNNLNNYYKQYCNGGSGYDNFEGSKYTRLNSVLKNYDFVLCRTSY